MPRNDLTEKYKLIDDFFITFCQNSGTIIMFSLPIYLIQMNGNTHCGLIDTQPAITCSKLTIETLEQGVKYGQS